jgi:preprotein translocase subunit YajC
MTAALGALFADPAATTKTTSSGSPIFLVILFIGAAFYFLIYRPQQKKQRATRALSNAFDVGDEVVTAGGIVGRVLDITDDRVTLETSVGASFTVLKPYVLRKLEPAEPPPDVVGDEYDHDEDDHDEDDEDVATHDDEADDSTNGSNAAPEPPSGPPADEDSNGTEATGPDSPPII